MAVSHRHHYALRARRATAALVVLLLLPLATMVLADDEGDLEGQITALQEKQRILRQWQQRQQQNIQAMRAEIERAKSEHRGPNPSKLQTLATATGQRSEAYHDAPPYIQQRIDQVSSHSLRNAGDATRLFISTLFGGRRLLHRQQYEVAIERSKHLLTALEHDERAVTAQLAAAKDRQEEQAAEADPENEEAEEVSPDQGTSFAALHAQRMETALAALEQQIDALGARVARYDLDELAREARRPLQAPLSQLRDDMEKFGGALKNAGSEYATIL